MRLRALRKRAAAGATATILPVCCDGRKRAFSVVLPSGLTLPLRVYFFAVCFFGCRTWEALHWLPDIYHLPLPSPAHTPSPYPLSWEREPPSPSAAFPGPCLHLHMYLGMRVAFLFILLLLPAKADLHHVAVTFFPLA